MAKVTCFQCKVKDEKDLMIQLQNKKYYHLNPCHQEYLLHQKFLEKEKRQKDELYETIMRIHCLKNSQEIPTLFFMKIEEVRNNSGLLGKINKKYKDGVSYASINYTYDFCINEINKGLFLMADKPLLQKMNYCLGIVRNNIVNAYNNVKNVNKQKENVIKLVESIDAANEVNEKIKNIQIQNKQNQNDAIDLSSLFD